MPGWRKELLAIRASELEGVPGVRRPRPPVCCPGDALILAERLLGL
ncbi:hypothetical protein ACOQFB_12145 [Anaeromyxobacter sp. Red801]